MSDASNTALVVGGGLAGMQASLVLAERGHRVVLLDERPAIGGLFPLLDNQFPTQSCGVCFMACDTPTYCPFVQCELHENVEILPYASVTSVEGEAGAFRVKVAQRASCVDPDKCTDCGACEEVCPVEVGREFGDGLEKRKAVYKYYPKAVGKAYVVDPDSCTRCGKCVEVCDPDAIDLDAAAGGARPWRPPRWCWPRVPTSSPRPARRSTASGATPTSCRRCSSSACWPRAAPAEGCRCGRRTASPPSSLAFVQCVGSRDAEIGQGHCSSVCCMFASSRPSSRRSGARAWTWRSTTWTCAPSARTTRTTCAGPRPLGIRFVRAIPSMIRQVPGSGELPAADRGRVPQGRGGQARPGGAVLGLLRARTGPGALAGAFGVGLAEGGFSGGPEFAPCETNVPGVYACGAFRDPKDIPESTAEAACAAGLAALQLAPPADAGEPDMPTPADFRAEAPKVGVFLCTCEGFNEQKADFGALGEAAEAMPGVAFVHTATHACSKAGMDEVRRVFAEREPNRVVLAACSYRIVEKLYGHMFGRMGVHPGVLSVANLREACLENGGGEAGARALLAQAVQESWYGGFAPVTRESVERTALVVGGGASGQTAALRLADLGHTVHLVEKEAALGGNLRTARYTVKGGAPGELLAALEARIKAHPNVRVYTGARVASASGRLGAFRTEVETREGPVEVLHGAVALATGAGEVKPGSYGYGRSPRVATQKELEQRLAEGKFSGGKVVMIQCVESREEAEGCRPYCSRVCCTHAVKNALKILETNPDAEVTVLYRDLRTYGAFEHFYRDARDRGVAFVSFDLSHRPAVEVQGDAVSVRYLDPGLGREVTETPDWVVLSAGMAPDAEGNRGLAALYGVEADAHGFFVEKNPKAATTDFAKKGVYMAGLCHAPKHIEESLSQAGAAAARCSALLAKGARRSLEKASYVVEKICSRCGVCVDVCPYGARSLDLADKNVAVVDALLCEACGACTMACPNKAAQQYGSAPKQVLMGLDELLG